MVCAGKIMQTSQAQNSFLQDQFSPAHAAISWKAHIPQTALHPLPKLRNIIIFADMKWRSLLSIFFLTSLLGCENPRLHLLNVFKSIDLEVRYNSRAYPLLQDICGRYGPRMAGTEAGTRVEELASLLFRSYGFDNVFFQPFTFNQWQRGSVRLRIDTSGTFTDFPALALAYTPTGNINAPIVDAGNGLPEDYKNMNVTGKIVLIHLGLLPGTPENVRNTHRAQKLSLAIAQGAAGCIAVNPIPGDLPTTGTATLDGGMIKIPAVSISYERGMQLKQSLSKRRCTAVLFTENSSGPAMARNVVARFEGYEFPAETIVVGAHLDSWDISPGALDNASGAVSVLDMARTFKALNLKTRRSIDFVLFMAEEAGHYGSELYVREARHNNRLEGIRYMFNLDMTVNTYGFNLMGRYESEDFFRETGATIHRTDSSFSNTIAHFSYLGSDHAPFLFEGIPTFTPLCRYEEYHTYHTSADTQEYITAPMLTDNVRISAMILYALANTPELPATRFTDEQIRQYLIDNQLQEELVISGDWKWD
jgi:Zn-dependent M28 family amino/carboxypeptidase